MTRARETSENTRKAKACVNFDGTFGSSPFTLANAAATTHARIQTGYYYGGYVLFDTEIVMLAFFHND